MTSTGIYALKPRFRASLRGIEGILVARGIGADTITLAGLGFALSAAAAMIVSVLGSAPLLMAAVAPLVLLRLACNALDGMVATDQGTARPAGLLLNEMCDRVADVALLGAAAIAAGNPWAGLAAIACVGLASAAGVTTQAAGGRRLYGGIAGKADRMLLLSAAALVGAAGLPVLAATVWLVACAATAAVTLVQRLVAAGHELAVVRPEDPR